MADTSLDRRHRRRGVETERESPPPPPPNAAPWPDDHEPTPFQQEVVDAVRRLEAGDLVTYGELAEELGRPGSAQAIANVRRGVPDLPWWRVVPAGGRLYRTHVRSQAPLLEAEGHAVDEHRRVHADARSAARRR